MGNTVGKYCFPSTSNKHCKVLKNSKNSLQTQHHHHHHHEQQSFNGYTYSDDNEAPPVIFTCEICVEEKHLANSFTAENCTHIYCIECIVKYIESKLQNNALIVTCPQPNCPDLLEPSYCRAILPYKLFTRWEKALCEQVIPENLKFYCPFKDCSALLINEGNNVITHSVCPHCGRNICVNCEAPWHEGFSCVNFQRLKNNEDALMMDLAKRSKWRRCPKCKHYIEKRKGCDFIKCRCKHLFCYRCGQSIITRMHNCSRKQY